MGGCGFVVPDIPAGLALDWSFWFSSDAIFGCVFADCVDWGWDVSPDLHSIPWPDTDGHCKNDVVCHVFENSFH